MDEHLGFEIGEWIVRRALAGTSDGDILTGVCERLNGAGMSLARAAVASDILDPTLDAYRATGIRRGDRSRRGDGEAFHHRFRRGAKTGSAANPRGQGGHVLKFIGDGMLAIFPSEGTVPACTRAPNAAADQRRRIAEFNERRAASGLPVTDTHLALHVGELLYGNVGSPRRLDFTVLGPAVNEAARIEALCVSLDQAVIVSSAFAEAAGDARSRLVSLGRYAMKGVARPQELFTLDPG